MRHRHTRSYGQCSSSRAGFGPRLLTRLVLGSRGRIAVDYRCRDEKVLVDDIVKVRGSRGPVERAVDQFGVWSDYADIIGIDEASTGSDETRECVVVVLGGKTRGAGTGDAIMEGSSCNKGEKWRS